MPPCPTRIGFPNETFFDLKLRICAENWTQYASQVSVFDMKEIKVYEPILSQIMLAIAEETRFHCEPPLQEVLAENPKLVVVFNHASPLSWLPAVALLSAHVNAKGGGERIPVGVMDKFFFEMPVLNKIAALLTQSETPHSFHDLTSKFADGEATDLVVFPEGSNCFFGDPAELKPFRSPKFVELAIRARAPILICVHKGSEIWGKAIPIPPEWFSYLEAVPPAVRKFLESRLKETGLLTIPLWPNKMDKFEMRCKLYRPQLKLEDLSEDETERRKQIQAEADHIHALMEPSAFQALLGKG
jgi:hypothetical protein